MLVFTRIGTGRNQVPVAFDKRLFLHTKRNLLTVLDKDIARQGDFPAIIRHKRTLAIRGDLTSFS
jgi:hypothetical protein